MWVNLGVNPITAVLVAELVSGSGTFTANQTYNQKGAAYPGTWTDNATIAAKSATTEVAITQAYSGFRLKATASTSLVANLRLVQAGC